MFILGQKRCYNNVLRFDLDKLRSKLRIIKYKERNKIYFDKKKQKIEKWKL